MIQVIVHVKKSTLTEGKLASKIFRISLRSLISAFKPEIKIPLKKVKVAVGQSVVLPCETEGKPTPRIYWKKGDVMLEEKRYHLHWKGNLTIDVRFGVCGLGGGGGVKMKFFS